MLAVAYFGFGRRIVQLVSIRPSVFSSVQCAVPLITAQSLIALLLLLRIVAFGELKSGPSLRYFIRPTIDCENGGKDILNLTQQQLLSRAVRRPNCCYSFQAGQRSLLEGRLSG